MMHRPWANTLLLTLRGTPTTYYGEEIGMENVPIPAEFVQDPPAVNQPEIADHGSKRWVVGDAAELDEAFAELDERWLRANGPRDATIERQILQHVFAPIRKHGNRQLQIF